MKYTHTHTYIVLNVLWLYIMISSLVGFLFCFVLGLLFSLMLFLHFRTSGLCFFCTLLDSFPFVYLFCSNLIFWFCFILLYFDLIILWFIIVPLNLVCFLMIEMEWILMWEKGGESGLERMESVTWIYYVRKNLFLI